jgi:Mg-chelatase subunit ChlD
MQAINLIAHSLARCLKGALWFRTEKPLPRSLYFSHMRSILLFLMFPLISTTVLGQKLAWESTSYNFGTVRDWDSPPAVFRVKNTGNSKLMFLPQHFGRDVQVVLPARSIAPGETAEVTIHYYTGENGPFSKDVELYSNASDRPQKLTVRGNILSLRNDALTACPTFGSDQPAQSSGTNTITVVDRSTGEQIVGATVELFRKGDSRARYVTDNRGLVRSKLEMGRFTAQVEHASYFPTVQEIALERRQGTVIIFLEPKKSAKAEQPNRTEEAVDKGIQVREVWTEKEPIDLGIAINNQMEATTSDDRWATDAPPTRTAENNPSEKIDLGISINEQTAEAVADDRWAEPASTEVEAKVQPQPQLDLGISINEQFDEPPAAAETPVAVPVETPQTSAVELPVSEFAEASYRPNNIVLLLDVSSSMRKEGKLDKLKAAAARLIGMMRPIDKLSVLAFNASVFTVVPPTSVESPETIIDLIFDLEAEGYTSGVKGMKEAYVQLADEWVDGGNNQLILVTDGMFNSSSFTEKDAIDLAADHAGRGIILSVAGYSGDPDAEKMMKRIAKRGKGSYLQLDAQDGAIEVLAEEIKERSRRPVSAQ